MVKYNKTDSVAWIFRNLQRKEKRNMQGFLDRKEIHIFDAARFSDIFKILLCIFFTLFFSRHIWANPH